MAAWHASRQGQTIRCTLEDVRHVQADLEEQKVHHQQRHESSSLCLHLQAQQFKSTAISRRSNFRTHELIRQQIKSEIRRPSNAKHSN